MHLLCVVYKGVTDSVQPFVQSPRALLEFGRRKSARVPSEAAYNAFCVICSGAPNGDASGVLTTYDCVIGGDNVEPFWGMYSQYTPQNGDVSV